MENAVMWGCFKAQLMFLVIVLVSTLIGELGKG